MNLSIGGFGLGMLSLISRLGVISALVGAASAASDYFGAAYFKAAYFKVRYMR